MRAWDRACLGQRVPPCTPCLVASRLRPTQSSSALSTAISRPPPFFSTPQVQAAAPAPGPVHLSQEHQLTQRSRRFGPSIPPVPCPAAPWAGARAAGGGRDRAPREAQASAGSSGGGGSGTSSSATCAAQPRACRSVSVWAARLRGRGARTGAAGGVAGQLRDKYGRRSGRDRSCGRRLGQG